MSTFFVPIEVSNLRRVPSHRVDAMVHTGSTDTCIPEDILRDLGVQPITERAYSQADESRRIYPVGQALVRLHGQEWVVPVVFVPPGTMPLLGAVTLEIFRLSVDPVKQELIPVEGLMK
jgi:clan AA aspartic protease